MTDTLLALVPQYGLYLVGLATFFSCLAMPIPSSLIMLTAGAFVAAGDLALVPVVGLALGGAVLGDQAGFWIGSRGSVLLRGEKAARLMARAQALSNHWGGPGVFLSRWLFSPLGPYVNFATGAARMNWVRFTIWGALGEVVWVSLYVGLGIGFAANIEALADVLGNFSGVLAAGVVTVGLWLWLRATLRAERRGLPPDAL